MDAELRDWFERAFPIEVASVRLDVHDARRTAEGVVVTLRLFVFEPDGEVREVKEQEITYPALTEGEVAALGARARTYALTRPEPELSMPLDFLREPTPYRPVCVQRTGEDRELFLQELTDAVRAQAQADGFAARFERLGDWSVAACTVYFLDLAHAMVGGNGLEVFLAQAPLEEVMGVLAAADEAGCTRFAQLYRTALGLAQQEGASEFLAFVDEDWLDEQASLGDEESSWSTIDHHAAGGTYSLLEQELHPALLRYVEAHHAELVQP